MAQSLFPGGTQNLMPPFERGLPQPFCTQALWAVDSAVGNDNAPGTPGAPLRTLAELSRRFLSLTVSPSLAAMSISLRGTFPNETLDLAGNYPNPNLVVQLSGQMTEVVPATAITTYTPEAAPVRAALTAGAIDFPLLLATYGQVRLRVTTGASAGALAWVQSSTGLGQANISQFITVSSAGAVAIVNPAVGSQFVVEVPATIVRNVTHQPQGPATHIFRDFGVSAGASISTSFLGGTRMYGVRFGSANAENLTVRGTNTGNTGTGSLICCASRGFLNVVGPAMNLLGHAAWQTLFCASGYMLATRVQFDGYGGGAAALVVQNGGVLEYNAPVSVWGSAGSGGRVVLVEDGAQLIGSTASAFYGTNTSALSALIRNGCVWSAVTLPTLVSAGAPNELSLAGAAGIPWAFAVAAAPNNAVLNARA